MKISKLLSILTLILLASQAICGFHLVNNPEAAAAGSTDFHKVLGIVTLIVATATVISVFRKVKKTA